MPYSLSLEAKAQAVSTNLNVAHNLKLPTTTFLVDSPISLSSRIAEGSTETFDLNLSKILVLIIRSTRGVDLSLKAQGLNDVWTNNYSVYRQLIFEEPLEIQHFKLKCAPALLVAPTVQPSFYPDAFVEVLIGGNFA